jgi:hypothetical protein
LARQKWLFSSESTQKANSHDLQLRTRHLAAVPLCSACPWLPHFLLIPSIKPSAKP